jgi:putative hydrolase of the HAD superfamily
MDYNLQTIIKLQWFDTNKGQGGNFVMGLSLRKFLVWDFDGTLAWRPGGWTEAVLDVLHKSDSGVHATPDQVQPYLQSGFPWHAPENAHPGLAQAEWWEDLQPVFIRTFRGLGLATNEAVALAGKVRNTYLDPLSWQNYSDTIPALDQLSARGWLHILLTNHVPELHGLLERLNLSGYFVAVFNSADTGYEKPNPKAFRPVTDFVIPCSECWMIGDSYGVDYLGAQEVGLSSILVRKPHPQASHFYATLKELAENLS